MDDWVAHSHRILRFSSKNESEVDMYCMVPFELGAAALRKRGAFIWGGNVYMGLAPTIDLVVGLYGTFLKEKL